MTSRDHKKCCEAVRLAILVTAWFLVISDSAEEFWGGAAAARSPPARGPGVSSLSGVRGGAPIANAFWAHREARKRG